MPGSWLNLFVSPAQDRSGQSAPIWPLVCGVFTLGALASGLVGPLIEDSVVKNWQGATLAESGRAATGLRSRNLVFKARPRLPDPTLGRFLGEELMCLALNIYFEARGEPAVGKLAVGHVVMNRVKARDFPGSVCGVVQQGGYRIRHRCQFSWWCDGRSDQPSHAAAWQESLALARRILDGKSTDPTAGALWYHADFVSPSWKNSLKQGPTFGRHIFYLKEGRS